MVEIQFDEDEFINEVGYNCETVNSIHNFIHYNYIQFKSLKFKMHIIKKYAGSIKSARKTYYSRNINYLTASVLFSNFHQEILSNILKKPLFK